MNSILITTIFSLMSCGPKLEEKQRQPIDIPNGKKFQDKTLNSFADLSFAQENLINRSSVQDSLKQLEMIFEIYQITQDQNWKTQIEKAYRDLEKNTIPKKISYSSSNYLNLVYEHIHTEVDSTVKSTDKKIAADTKKVIELVRKTQKNSLKITLESALHEKLDAAQNFMSTLTSEIKKANILQEFKDSFLPELNKQSQTLLTEAVRFDEAFVRAESLKNSLSLISTFLQKTATQISSEDQNNLILGQQLADSLETMKDSQTGLQAITLVWTLLNDQQRLTYIKEANKDLYDFLSDKSAEDIQCMREKNCRGFKTKIVLNLGVYPAIEKFGLKNIVDLINQKSLLFINQKVNQVAFDILNKIGELISDRVVVTVNQKRADLGQFKDNLRGHLSKGLEQKFLTQKIKSPSAFLIDSQSSLLDFDTQSVYIRNKIHYLPFSTEKNKTLQSQFEIVEGVVSLPLFSQSPQTEEKTLQSDLTELLLNPEPRQFLNSLSNPQSEVHLKQQSELLITTSAALEELADWKKTTFDEGLSQIKASEILTQFKTKELEKSFFPKNDLAALMLSISSQVLKLMQSADSMLVLVDNTNQILPIQKVMDTSASSIALAAATDFKKGARTSTAKASDIGDFVSALSRFYQATEGIENTQSEILTRQQDSQSSFLDQAIAARKQIKLLIVALANFISNQLIQSNGLISKSIALNENLKPLQQYELLDQTRAIGALVKAYELTRIDAYLWTAQNIYYSMNWLLYSDKINFYQQNTENEVQSAIDKTKLLETYKDLLQLKPYLGLEQQEQFEKIFSAWLKI